MSQPFFCQNTAISKLLYDYISGFHHKNEERTPSFQNGRLDLFQNFQADGTSLERPHTLLIDSEQLESGDALDKDFREVASEEIEYFRREMVERTGDVRVEDYLKDEDILREVMNTVGKPGAFAEFCDVYEIRADFEKRVGSLFNNIDRYV